MSATDLRVPTSIWTEGVEGMEGERVYVEVERTDADEVALHTMDGEGHGSVYSMYWTREQAIDMARRLLDAAVLR